jgi:hypothetical protein
LKYNDDLTITLYNWELSNDPMKNFIF